MKIDVDHLPVEHNEAEQQFEIHVEGEVAFVSYFVRGSTIYYVHTIVPEPFERHGLAGRLARHALDYARANGLSVVPRCPYVAAYVRDHPEYADLIAAESPATLPPSRQRGANP